MNEGGDGPGAGKRIVLVSGDEEYRSEEALPQLAKILSERHGFDTVVLFAQDPRVAGIINPNYSSNIPGLEALREADLMIIATRFPRLAETDQMRSRQLPKVRPSRHRPAHRHPCLQRSGRWKMGPLQF